MRRSVVGGILALLLLAVVQPSGARPITHEDIWTMRRLGAPKVSPDGKRVILSVTEPSYDKDKQVSDLWLLSTDGSTPPRRLTSTPGSESGAAWSPTGDRLVFTAKRGKDKVSQIYVMDMTGPGEAQKVSDFPLPCSGPRFTPDGKGILFEAQVYPGPTDAASQEKARKADQERKEKVSSYEGFPIRYWDHWLNGRHPRPYLLTLDSKEAPRDLLAGTSLVESGGFAGVSGLSGETLQAVISPDGKDLVFVATTNRDQAVTTSTHYNIYRCPLTGGEPELVPGPSGSRTDPTFAADGMFYTTVEAENEFVYNLVDLVRQEWPVKGPGKNLTAGSDLSVNEFVVSPGGRVFFSATTIGRKRIFELGPQGAKPLDPSSRGIFSGLDWAGSGLVCRYEHGAQPVEVVKVSPGDGAVKSLSKFNQPRVAEIDWQPFREFWFQSKGGRKIHNWVVLPPNFSEDKKYPLVLFIHGGPHSSSLDSGHVRWSPQLLASPGYVVLLTDYTGSVGYGASFAQAIQGDPLKTPGEELLQAVDEAVARYPFIDSGRVAASGASYGGHMVNWMEATSDRFRCLIGHAGLISLEGQWATSDAVSHREKNLGGPPWEGNPIWKEQSPASYVTSFKTPIMLTVGEKDYRVPLNQTLAAWTYLQRMKVPSKLMVYHQANHWIMSGPDARHFWSEVHNWLAKYLKAD